MAKDNGGPAYPAKIVKEDIAGRRRVSRHGGMTLRDWFAGQVLHGFGANWRFDESPLAASYAYEIADAMLAERNK